MPKDNTVSDPDNRQAAPLLKPLISASEMFPALERLCLGATSELLMSFRILDARTLLRSEEALSLGLKTWADLLVHVAERGVKLRILTADFDPVFAAALHRQAWNSAGIFGRRLPPSAEVLCALHECRVGYLWQRLLWRKVRAALAKLRETPHETLTHPQHRALQGDIVLRPVSLHQKFAVADGRHAIIGGIDVDERRWDDQEHDRPPEETWHDVSLEVRGEVVPDLRRHFADCWERARSIGATSFASDATPLTDLRPPGEHCDDPRLIRTISCHPNSPFRLGASPVRTEHEEAHLDIISKAERLIYIETQFFRHLPIAKALAKRAKEVPALNIILVVPTEPERVIFDHQHGIDARHAQGLQLRCVDFVRRAAGERLAVLSPAQPRSAGPNTPMPVHGGGIIYLHAKVTIVDDHSAIVGSANLNGRSMRWDTEASLLFHDADQIRDLRGRLIKHWLRDRVDQIDHCSAAAWTRLAWEEAARQPEERQAIVLPWPEKRNRRFARMMPFMPPEMF